MTTEQRAAAREQERKCGHCGMAIHPSETLRYFGFSVAHQEYRCMELLRGRIAELEADKARLQSAIDAVNGLEAGQSYIGPLHGAGMADGLRWARETIAKAMKPAVFDPAEPKGAKSIV